MDDREVVLIAGVYVAVVVLLALVLLTGGTDVEEYISNWNAVSDLTNERMSWETNI